MSANRAERRRAQKAHAKQPAAKPGVIQLANPVSHHYESFILANAVQWETLVLAELDRVCPGLRETIAEDQVAVCTAEGMTADITQNMVSLAIRRAVDEHCRERYVVEQESAAGQHIVICGAGPSLRETAAEWCPQGDQVWGCNSALTWLVNNGHKVTHGYTVDQTAEMLHEWQSTPDVEYLIASSVHAHLAEFLISRGRRVRWFHNFVGVQKDPVSWPDAQGDMRTMAYEDWLYTLMFSGTLRCGSGLNSVTRAIDVALFMGAAKITVLGADCAMVLTAPPPKNAAQGSPEHLAWLREHTVMHADGGNALASNATPVTLGAVIDAGTEDDTVRAGYGEHWETKPDMIISAVWLERWRRAMPERLNIVGHTLPNALRRKSDAYLNRLPSLVDHLGNPIDMTSMIPKVVGAKRPNA